MARGLNDQGILLIIPHSKSEKIEDLVDFLFTKIHENSRKFTKIHENSRIPKFGYVFARFKKINSFPSPSTHTGYDTVGYFEQLPFVLELRVLHCFYNFRLRQPYKL